MADVVQVLGISDSMLCKLVARGKVDYMAGAGPGRHCRYYNTAAIVAFMRGNARLKSKVSGVWLQDAVRAGAQTAYDTMCRDHIIEYGAHDSAMSLSYAQHLRVMLRSGVTLPKQFDELVRRIAARPQWCERDVIYKTWLWVRAVADDEREAPSSDWVTVPEAAKRVGRASSTVRRWAQHGKVDVRTESRDGRQVRLVDVSEAAATARVDLSQNDDTQPEAEVVPEPQVIDDRLAQCIEVVRTQEARILEVSEEVATLRALVQSLQQQLDDGREQREAIAAGLVRYDGAGAWRRLFGRLFAAGE
jgi:hypothetical protein